MIKRYESLTNLIPALEKDFYGGWNVHQDGDGTAEKPFIVPYVSYTLIVYSFFFEMGKIERQHPNYHFRGYKKYLTQRGVISSGKGSFPIDELKTISVERLNEEDILVMLFALQRSDRFCEGLLLDFFRSGTILKWLKRLEKIDE